MHACQGNCLREERHLKSSLVDRIYISYHQNYFRHKRWTTSRFFRVPRELEKANLARDLPSYSLITKSLFLKAYRCSRLSCHAASSISFDFDLRKVSKQSTPCNLFTSLTLTSHILQLHELIRNTCLINNEAVLDQIYAILSFFTPEPWSQSVIYFTCLIWFIQFVRRWYDTYHIISRQFWLTGSNT